MAYNNEYPYVDPNRHNSDWLLHEMAQTKETVEELKRQLKNNFNALVLEFFNEIMPGVIYDESNERITLSFKNENIVSSATHAYDSKTDTLVIKKRED